jgi:hypothetical protein
MDSYQEVIDEELIQTNEVPIFCNVIIIERKSQQSYYGERQPEDSRKPCCKYG